MSTMVDHYASLRILLGMAASAPGASDEDRRLSETMETVWEGTVIPSYMRRDGWRGPNPQYGLDVTMIIGEDDGTAETVYFRYSPIDDPDFLYHPIAHGKVTEALVRAHLEDRLGFGLSCGHTHDCCGCWSRRSLELWGGGPRKEVWFGKFSRHMNV